MEKSAVHDGVRGVCHNNTVRRLRTFDFMNQPFLRPLFSILLFACFCSTPSFGRLVPVWPYEKLVAESDVVAIVEPLENKPAKDTFPGYTYGHTTNDFAATDTRFRVHAVFKMKGDAPKELTVLHFSYSTNVTLIANGASFIRFLTGPLQYEKRALKDGKPVGGITMFHQQPMWLAFLKRREDGRFEPVTGHYDSAYSFRELHEASFYAHP